MESETVAAPALRPAGRRPIDGNTSTHLLKLLALVFMFCDHAGKMLLPNVPEMRMIGRIAFPIYCWCLVVGFNYTHNPLRYALRLVGFWVISQPFYMLALNHKWYEPNILLTLLLGLLAIWAIHEKKGGSQFWGPVLALLLALPLDANYGWNGVLLIILLYCAQESKAAIAAVLIAFCLYWGSTSYAVRSIFGVSTGPMHEIAAITAEDGALGALQQIQNGLITAVNALIRSWNALTSPWLRLQAMAVLSLPLIVIPFGKDVKLPIWMGYVLYPGHLIVLWLIELLVRYWPEITAFFGLGG